MDPAPFLDEAEGLGVDSVEVPFFAARLMANGAVLEPTARLFEQRLEGRRLARSTHALLSINLMGPAEQLPRHERLAETCIELTARLGARNMVLHCGLSAENGEAMEAAYGRQRAALARLGEVAARHDVVICVETIWNFDGRETALPSRLAEEIRAVDHDSVKATLDYAHAALQCAVKRADLMTEAAALAPLAAHIHVNDCFGAVHESAVPLAGESLAYGSGDLHLPLGWGDLPFEELMTGPAYPDEVIVNDELHPTYWRALGDDVAEMRRLARLMTRDNAPGGA